jgi:hypothetical protein
MKEIKLTLQENEVRAVFQLIDVAVKLQEQAKDQWSEPIEKEEEQEAE